MSQRWAQPPVRVSGLVLAMITSSAPMLAQDRAGAGVVKVPVTTEVIEARQEYLKGRALGENLRAHDSREVLQRAVAKDPNFALGHYSLALNSPTAKEFFSHLNQAVKLSGKASEGERLMILGLQAGANADTDRQRRYYEQLVEAYPQDERAHFLLGNTYFGQQDYAKALREYQKSVEVAPDFAPAYNLLGYAYRQVERYDEAEKAFKKYIELIPGDPNPYDSYAELLMRMGLFDESVAMYRKALATDPNFSPSYIGIASNLTYQKKYDAARAEAWKLHQAARNDADRRNALFATAIAYADEGKLDQARAALHSKDLAGARKHADMFMQGATAKKNRAEIRQAHELSGMIALKEKQFDQAIAHLGKANQQDPYVLYRIGKAYKGKGDQAKADELFRRASNHTTLPTLNHAFVRAKANKVKA